METARLRPKPLRACFVCPPRASQSIELEPDDLRRLHDRLLKWIEGVPLNQVLVVKASGLYGKPSIFSSYQPKGGINAVEEGDGDQPGLLTGIRDESGEE